MKDLRGGRYTLMKALGEGAQGETWEAVDRREGRLVAIKAFRIHKAKAWKDVELAEREARTLAALAHDRLPKYVEHFEEEGTLYLVMEHIEGEDLGSLRKAGKTFTLADVRRMLDDAARALGYLHGRTPPIIHRDLKPRNVLRKKDGSFAFVDFGSVRDHLRPEGGSTIAGTFGYMAPEQFQGRASPVTDVFGIGATALVMLTGREPEDLPHKGLAIDVAAAVPAGTPASLVAALSAMLEPDPDKRAPTIAIALKRAGDAAPPRAAAAAPSPSATRAEADHRDDDDDDAEEEGSRDARRTARRERRDARRDARKARREADRARKRARRSFVEAHWRETAALRFCFWVLASLVSLGVLILLPLAKTGTLLAVALTALFVSRAVVTVRRAGWLEPDEPRARISASEDTRVRAVTPQQAQAEAIREAARQRRLAEEAAKAEEHDDEDDDDREEEGGHTPKRRR